MGRDAFEISVSPRQNFLNPPPVPEIPTVTFTLPFIDFWNSSATASVIGKTVLEPSILTVWADAIGAMLNAPTTAAADARRFTDNSSFIESLLALPIEFDRWYCAPVTPP